MDKEGGRLVLERRFCDQQRRKWKVTFRRQRQWTTTHMAIFKWWFRYYPPPPPSTRMYLTDTLLALKWPKLSDSVLAIIGHFELGALSLLAVILNSFSHVLHHLPLTAWHGCWLNDGRTDGHHMAGCPSIDSESVRQPLMDSPDRINEQPEKKKFLGNE